MVNAKFENYMIVVPFKIRFQSRFHQVLVLQHIQALGGFTKALIRAELRSYRQRDTIRCLVRA